MPITVSKYIDTIESGTIFIADDIDTQSSYDSVKTQLSQACSSGRIERIYHGIYRKPKFNDRLGMYVPSNIDSIARTIARQNGWRIIPGGDQCLNILGLSTQVPSKYQYLSDGPYKEYDIQGSHIEFKHRVPKNFPENELTAIVIQAICAQGKNNCDDAFVERLSRSINDDDKITVLDNIGRPSAWIENVIKRAFA
ncbi:MAG: type IV toxin-antitoxin system AbiEi family antitoxin domain-containing protein [Candidatus Methanomethylophilaceae archaeon]|nr:type IV toxin-antitoxin system AbiEi family antitoxin domain-containing protein [Candidatus Methanomethylophilaceae archaeon]MBO7352153.1 type IV toxin-antitoxin system AbiEi family antitoxin domain-containing protein [Candidatus Methanomethylophilaceae archaeon]